MGVAFPFPEREEAAWLFRAASFDSRTTKYCIPYLFHHLINQFYPFFFA
jgi:hypothetical protein